MRSPSSAGAPDTDRNPDVGRAPDPTRRRVGDLEIRIDRDLCVGFGDCVTVAPQAFELDDDGIAVFSDPSAATRQALLDACAACPVDALEVFDETGERIVP